MKCLTIRSSTLLQRQSALEAAAKAAGWTVKELHHSPGRPTPEIDPDCQFAICSGLPARSAPAWTACQKLGIPLLIAELGYLKRANDSRDTDGYFQVGWNRIGWTPASAPADRFEALGLEVRDQELGAGNRILIAGQVGNDSQHRMSSRELNDWLCARGEVVAAQLRLPRWWRPHPRQPDSVPGTWSKARIQLPSRVPLAQAFDQVATVVTYNSTLGVDAMLNGTPVDSHPSAHYHAHAVTERATRMAYLHRLAYAQWNMAELEGGQALEFALAHRPGN